MYINLEQPLFKITKKNLPLNGVWFINRSALSDFLRFLCYGLSFPISKALIAESTLLLSGDSLYTYNTRGTAVSDYYLCFNNINHKCRTCKPFIVTIQKCSLTIQNTTAFIA